MEQNKMERREARRPMERHRNEGSTAAATAWKIVGGATLAIAVVTFVVALPDLKRYIKISSM